MKPKLLSFVFVAFSIVAAKGQSPLAFNIDEARGELEIRFRNQKMLVYAFATNQFKPYVRELYTTRGENVLRDAPADHLHHHGLMYAIHVGGTNFWEEVGAAGVEKPVKLLDYKTLNTRDGLPQAQFTHLIHWLAFTNKPVRDSASAALLIEQRTLTLTVDEKNEEVALRWDSGFEIGKNAGKVTLHGTSYNGLGLRLPGSFDHVAKFQNSADSPYTAADSHDVIAAKWSAVSGSIEGHAVMVVLFSHIGNARGDGWFFSMRDPFAYLSATQGLDKVPIEHVAGTKFHLNYLLAVYPENKTREFTQRRYELWEKEAR
jgi:hypothetical protein